MSELFYLSVHVLSVYLPCHAAADSPALCRICKVHVSGNVKLHLSADLPIESEVHAVCISELIEVVVTFHKASKAISCTETKAECGKSRRSRKRAVPLCTEIVADAEPVADWIFKKEI